MAAHSVFLPREYHGQRSLVGYIVRRIAKSQMRLRGIKYQSENNENLCLPMSDFISEKH